MKGMEKMLSPPVPPCFPLLDKSGSGNRYEEQIYLPTLGITLPLPEWR